MQEFFKELRIPNFKLGYFFQENAVFLKDF